MSVTFTGCWAYLVGALFVFGVGVLLCVCCPRVRRASLLAGAAFAPTGPLFELLYLRDAWRPEFLLRFDIGFWRFGVEDAILAAAVAGIGAGVMELLYRRQCGSVLPAATALGMAALVGAGFLGLALTWLGVQAGLMSQHAQIYLVVAVWVLVVAAERPAWALSSVGAAVAMAGVMGFFYTAFFLPLFPGIIRDWWLLENYWGWYLGPLPLEEFAWAGACALYCSGALRFCLEKGALAGQRRDKSRAALPGLTILPDRSPPFPS